jgi:hypothetical protein
MTVSREELGLLRMSAGDWTVVRRVGIVDASHQLQVRVDPRTTWGGRIDLGADRV